MNLKSFFPIFTLFLIFQLSFGAENGLCTDPSAKNQVKLNFYSYCDMSKWVKKPEKLRWFIALSKKEIVNVTMSNKNLYNNLAVDIKTLGPHLILKNIKTLEMASVHITPGVYDYLILMDRDGDGEPDTYLGTKATNIRLKEFKFEAGNEYLIEVDKNSIAHMKIINK